jgi:hypothetical protein
LGLGRETAISGSTGTFDSPVIMREAVGCAMELLAETFGAAGAEAGGGGADSTFTTLAGSLVAADPGWTTTIPDCAECGVGGAVALSAILVATTRGPGELVTGAALTLGPVAADAIVAGGGVLAGTFVAGPAGAARVADVMEILLAAGAGATFGATNLVVGVALVATRVLAVADFADAFDARRAAAASEADCTPFGFSSGSGGNTDFKNTVSTT